MHHSEADADTPGDLSQGLAFGASGKDRAALVLIDHAGPAAGASLPGILLRY